MDGSLIPVPREHTLAGFASQAGCDRGVAIESLDAGATLTIRTLHTQYRLVVLDPAERTALVQGGSHFPDAIAAVLQGSTAGRNVVKTGWIGIGLRMELHVGRRRIVTSPVQAVVVEP